MFEEVQNAIHIFPMIQIIDDIGIFKTPYIREVDLFFIIQEADRFQAFKRLPHKRLVRSLINHIMLSVGYLRHKGGCSGQVVCRTKAVNFAQTMKNDIFVSNHERKVIAGNITRNVDNSNDNRVMAQTTCGLQNIRRNIAPIIPFHKQICGDSGYHLISKVLAL